MKLNEKYDFIMKPITMRNWTYLGETERCYKVRKKSKYGTTEYHIPKKQVTLISKGTDKRKK